MRVRVRVRVGGGGEGPSCSLISIETTGAPTWPLLRSRGVALRAWLR